MHLHLSPKIYIPWDDSDNTFYTTAGQDNDASLSSTASSTITSNLNQIPPSTQNPYQWPAIHPPPQPTIINSIWLWLQPQWPIPLSITQPPQPALPCTAVPPACNNTKHQTILPCSHHNHHWGDQMPLPKPRNVFRIISCNINSLSTQLDYVQWKAAAQAIHEINANSVSLQETNITWNKIHQHRIWQIFHNTTGHASISTTISSEIPTQSHQWGSTLQALVGDWASRTIIHGQDKSGLGRWSYIKLQGKTINASLFCQDIMWVTIKNLTLDQITLTISNINCSINKAIDHQIPEHNLSTTLFNSSTNGKPRTRLFWYALMQTKTLKSPALLGSPTSSPRPTS